jgi:hypothetical protein
VEIRSRLAGLDAEHLAPVVQRALNDPTAWPMTWTHEPLGASLVNPATAGLFHWTGTARDGSGAEVPWRVVLKVVADIEFGDPVWDQGYMHAEHDWNYWKREVLVRQSGFLDRYEHPLVPVRCLGVEEPAPKEGWLWTEALGDWGGRPRWPVHVLARSARNLGVFSAQGVDHAAELDGYSWAARHWLRGWVSSARGWGADHAAGHAECWNHPLLAETLPAGTAQRFAALVNEAADILDVVESLPVTVAHHDAQWSNLFQTDGADPAGRTVAIDWSYLGLAPVGEDLGHHIGCNIANRAVDAHQIRQHHQSATKAYLQGLSDAGWRGDEQNVLLARSAGAALQIALLAGLEVISLCGHGTTEDADDSEQQAWPYQLADRLNITVHDAVLGWVRGLSHLLDMGDEARRLAEVTKLN